eukprot:4910205-Amphidinium_carterae.2
MRLEASSPIAGNYLVRQTLEQGTRIMDKHAEVIVLKTSSALLQPVVVLRQIPAHGLCSSRQFI